MRFKLYDNTVLMIATDHGKRLELGITEYTVFDLSDHGKERIEAEYQEIPKNIESMIRPIIDKFINNPYTVFNYCYYKPAQRKQVELIQNMLKSL